MASWDSATDLLPTVLAGIVLRHARAAGTPDVPGELGALGGPIGTQPLPLLRVIVDRRIRLPNGLGDHRDALYTLEHHAGLRDPAGIAVGRGRPLGSSFRARFRSRAVSVLTGEDADSRDLLVDCRDRRGLLGLELSQHCRPVDSSYPRPACLPACLGLTSSPWKRELARSRGASAPTRGRPCNERHGPLALCAPPQRRA